MTFKNQFETNMNSKLYANVGNKVFIEWLLKNNNEADTVASAGLVPILGIIIFQTIIANIYKIYFSKKQICNTGVTNIVLKSIFLIIKN